MHRSSETIGAIAAALAKAQSELSNPEKSLVGTIRLQGRSERSFRYAPLASGLDLIRRSLGRHEIAAVQTTSIDSDAGLIRLSTVLAHSSGEWISSDWPVCPVSDTAEPQRMGAALTYARRYALFTLVGIAGEDDLDAPDLPVPREPIASGDKDRAAAQLPAAPPRSRQRPRPPKPVLEADRSLELGERLKVELEAVASQETLINWAHRVIPAKNSLRSEEARALEAAFEARMAALAHQEPPASGTNDDAAAAPAEHATSANGNISPALLAIPKTPRRRDKKHLRFVSSQPCLVCGRSPSDAHHLRFAEPRALGRKVSDEFTVPLCRIHHRALHDAANERAWWNDVNVDPAPIAHQLWRETRGVNDVQC
jgi:hypothetical protein